MLGPRYPRSTLTRLARSVMSCFGVCALSMPVMALSQEEWVSAIVRFVEWPVPVSVIDGPLVVCQKHASPALELDGKQVRGLTLTVRRVALPRQLVGCHIYAELAGGEASWTAWLKSVNQLNISATAARSLAPSARSFPFILAVGRGAQFCDLGGAICLVPHAVTGFENYRLNLDTLSRAGFRVDTHLLRSHPSRPAKAQ